MIIIFDSSTTLIGSVLNNKNKNKIKNPFGGFLAISRLLFSTVLIKSANVL